MVQNGAGSTVGQAVIQLAAARGIITVNMLRQHPEWAKMVAHLQGIGGTSVVSEEAAGRHDFRKMLADFPPPKLGLNGVGGAPAGVVARALGAGATLVTYGAASGRPVSVPLDLFTHKDLTLRGFSLAKAAGGASKAERDAAATAAVSAVTSGAVTLLVAREPFADFNIALERSLKPFQRKVVLTF